MSAAAVNNGSADPQRTELICQMYGDGYTLQWIGNHFGVTRERVRQILTTEGIACRRRGAKGRVSASIPKPKRQVGEWLDIRDFAAYGCNHAETTACNDGLPLSRRGSPAWLFRKQKENAQSRGIGWTLTLPQWVAIWRESGHFAERGNGGYVMARSGDVGPYALGNVYITTSAQNIKDGFAFRRARGLRRSDLGMTHSAKPAKRMVA